MKELTNLVQKLSHGKKTYVSRKLRRDNPADSPAVRLFQLLCQYPEASDQQLKAKLQAQTGAVKNYARLKRTLYQQVLGALQASAGEDNPYIQALNRLSQVEVLRELNLPDEAEALLNQSGPGQGPLQRPPLSFAAHDQQHLLLMYRVQGETDPFQRMLRSYRRELEALKRYEHQRRLDELAIRIFALRDRYWPVRRRRPIRQALAAEQLDRALLGRATQDTSPMLRVRAYRAMASLYLLEGDFAAAEETVRRGLRLAHKHDELYDYFAAPFLSELAVVAAYQHDAFGLAEAMQGLQTLIRTYPGEEPLFSYGRLLYYTYALKRCSVCRLGPGQEGGQDVAEAAAAFWQGVPAAVRGMLIRYAIGLFFHLAQYHLYFGNPAQARSWVERLLQERELLRRRPALYNAALLLRTIVAVEEAAWEEVQSHMRSWQEFRREHPELRLSLEASVRRLVRRLQQRKPHDPAEEIVARWQPYAQELAEAPDNQTMRQFFDFPFWLRLYHQRLSAAPPHAGPAAHTLALEEAAAAYTPTPAGPAPRQEG